MYMHVHTCSMLFIHVNDSLCMCSNLIHAQQVAATRYHIYTHHNATFPFKSSLTENGEITWALGSDSSSTFGGGPSGAVSDQRVISDASTTCGFAPRGSIVFIGNHATTTADQHSAPPSHRFKRLDLDRETWKISTFAERALSFRACMWWTVWPSHDMTVSDLWRWCALIGKDPRNGDFRLGAAQWYGVVWKCSFVPLLGSEQLC